MDYTAEDEVIIKEKWDDLLLSCTKICKNDEDWNFIKRAFFLAKEAHQGVRRRSGEPYLLHPIAVAKIVIEEIGLGVKSVVAALLHDVVEDTEYTVEDMERIFGPKIASMVDGLTKMSGVFNAGSGQARSFADLARATFAAAGKEPSIAYIDMPEAIRDRYQYFTEASMDRIRALGYGGQSTPLEEGVRRYVQDFLAQPDSYR